MAGKRGNGEGSIKQRENGLSEARISVGDGRRKSLYGKTRQEVAGKMAAAIRDRDKGLPIIRDDRQTVKAYLTGWIESMRPPAVRESTWINYEHYA